MSPMLLLCVCFPALDAAKQAGMYLQCCCYGGGGDILHASSHLPTGKAVWGGALCLPVACTAALAKHGKACGVCCCCFGGVGKVLLLVMSSNGRVLHSPHVCFMSRPTAT